jgi:hypothetical protein
MYLEFKRSKVIEYIWIWKISQKHTSMHDCQLRVWKGYEYVRFYIENMDELLLTMKNDMYSCVFLIEVDE